MRKGHIKESQLGIVNSLMKKILFAMGRIKKYIFLQVTIKQHKTCKIYIKYWNSSSRKNFIFFSLFLSTKRFCVTLKFTFVHQLILLMILFSSCHFRFFKCSISFQQSFFIFFLFLLSPFRALTSNLRTCGINFSSTFLNFFKVVFNYRHLDADCLISLFIFIFSNRLYLVNLFFCFYISKPDF